MDITYLLLSLLKICTANWDAWFIVILFVFQKGLMKSIHFLKGYTLRNCQVKKS